MIKGLLKNWVLPKKSHDDIIGQLLAHRGIKPPAKSQFLNPDFSKDIENPFLLKGMEKAVELIGQAIKLDRPIGIFGDYDVDGLTSTVFLYDIFKHLNKDAEPIVYLPSRQEGYGLNKEGIDYLAQKGAKLLITVDCGITAQKEISYAQKIGLKTIVIDHHLPSKTLPRAEAIINPKQPGDKYPFKDFSSAGLVFKLAQGLKLPERFLKWSLDLVALSTICDITPLLDENRVLAKFGLLVLQKTKRLGLKKLYEIAQIDPQTISVYTVGFLIGPRLNAPGRINHANESFALLVSQEPDEASRLAQKLDQTNRQRQKELERVLREAVEAVEKKKLHQKKVIVVAGVGWPAGIVGLVAAKLTDKYCRPSLVLEAKKDHYRGSGRSIDGFHLVEALGNCQKYLTGFGGHAKAAGVTLAKEHLELLYDELLAVAEKRLTEDDLVPKITIDAELNSGQIDHTFYQSIKQFEPFGLGNPRPVFLTRGLNVATLKLVGADAKHLKINFSANGRSFSAIGFGLGELAGKIKVGDIVDCVYTLDEDTWNGAQNIQLKILDLCIALDR